MSTMKEIQSNIDGFLDRAASLDWNSMDEEERREMEIAMEDALRELETAEAEKVDAYAFVLKEYEAKAKFLKDEAKALAEKAKAAESAAMRFKGRILWLIGQRHGSPLVGNKYKLSARTSKKVQIINETALPPEYLRTRTQTVPDKSLLGNVLKSGQEIPGAVLVENQSLSIR